MAARAATWLAIVVGGSGGALFALVGSGGAPTPRPVAPSHAPPRPAELAAQAPTTTALQAVPGPASDTPSAPSASVAASAPSVSAAPAASETLTARSATPPPASVVPSTTAAAPPPAADLLPLPTTKKALLRAEMRCDQRKAESCIVAARSYEAGSTGVTDPEKAAKYRRIALTAWISQCDHNSPVACATLATMYRAGSGVPQSDRNADALVARARQLCRFNDAPVCHELPSP